MRFLLIEFKDLTLKDKVKREKGPYTYKTNERQTEKEIQAQRGLK